MAKVLITGGAGYVGSHCAKALAAAGHDGVVYDSLVFGHRAFAKWGPLVVGDIRDSAALRAVMAEHRFDAVLHLAARAYVGQSVADPGLYYDVNVGGTRALLQAMRDTGIAKIVFSSSCAVYGEPPTTPITETMPLAPINPYGFTKLVCERMMDDFDATCGLKSVRLRYFNAAGADPSGEIGEDHDPETHLIPLVIDAALGRRPCVKIFGTDYPTADGTAVRDYVHVTDLASAHVKALDGLLRGGESMAVNLGTGRGVSVREIIAGVEEATGREVPVIVAGRRPGDPAVLVADASLARRFLHWSPSRDAIDLSITDACRWHNTRFDNAP